MARQFELFGEAERGVRPARVAEEVRALAGALPGTLRLGTSSWSFPGWAGLVWERAASRQRLAREGLAAYARHPLFRTVGLDRTYYAPLAAEALATYAGQVPEDFRFVVKAHEGCVLPRIAARTNPRFLDPAWATDVVVGPLREGLGPKAGALVFQFPPLAPGACGGPERMAERLHAFLTGLPRGPLYAVEIRTADWLTTLWADALRAAGAVPCLTVHPRMPSLERQLERLALAAGPALVVRWNLGHGLGYEAARERYAPFDRLVAEDAPTRRSLAQLCRDAVRGGRPAWVTINNKAEGSAPLSVLALARAILAQGPSG